MQSSLVGSHLPSPQDSDSDLSPAWKPTLVLPSLTRTSDLADRQVHAMLAGYRKSGGVVNGDVVVRLLRLRSEQPISLLARWIVSRQVVSFTWRAQTQLPLFQFDLVRMEVRASVQTVVAELSKAFDDWDLASWFAQPNTWLAGAVPADAIELNLTGVLQAARADRFVAMG